MNKKGRPVSQCPHCRSLRKNRSQHVRCECHDKSHAKEDCPHLKDFQQEGSGGKAQAVSTHNSALTRVTGSPPSTCCCGHGGKCSCALKKDPYLDTVPEELSSALQSYRKSTGPNVNQHDSKPITIGSITNGHHKPQHKFNDAHNHCGAPYRIPSRSNSHHGHGHRELAQRSTDSLPLPNRNVVHHESPLHNVLSAAQTQRQIRSEHNSPLLAPTSNPGIPLQFEIPPLDPNAYGYTPSDAQSPGFRPAPHLPAEIPDHWFTSYDDAHQEGPPAVPELAYIDWSNYGFGNTPMGSNTPQLPSPGPMKSMFGDLTNSQPLSYANSMEHLNQALGSGFNTSSGDLSEVDELPTNFRPPPFRTISTASGDLSSAGATEDEQSHRYSNASSYFGTPAGNALAKDVEDLDIDKFIAEKSQMNKHSMAFHQSMMMSPDYQQQQFQPQLQPQYQQPTPPQSQHQMSTPPESITGFSITAHPSPPEPTEYTAPYSIQQAQAQAHMRANNQYFQPKVLPRTFSNPETFDDPILYTADTNYDGHTTTFGLDDPQEEEQWAR